MGVWKSIYILTCFLILWIKNTTGQDGAFCTTPLEESGICISIKLCDSLLNLLKAKGATPEVSTLLRESACGWSGQYPLVCCPNLASKTASTDIVRPTVTDTTVTHLPQVSAKYTLITLPRPPYCGHSNISKSRIVNGVPALLGEFPWIVALGYRNPKNPSTPKWLCGGSLITDRHILTAAHCVHNRADLYLARLGELDLYDDNDGAQPSDIAVASVKIHEQFNPTTYTNDIAIITLAQPNTNPTTSPICLPIDEPLRSNDFVRYYMFVAGWGALYFNGPASSKLQTIMLPVVTNEQCSRSFINFRTTTIDQRVLCAGFTSGGRDACQGDSGGPLMHAKVESSKITYYQIGVVSYGFRCAEQGYPGVYTRITFFLDWIQQNLS